MIRYMRELMFGKDRERREWTMRTKDGKIHRFGKRRTKMFFKKERKWFDF